MTDTSPAEPAHPAALGESLSQLAAAGASGEVVIAVKARTGADDAVAVAAVTGAARAQGGRQRQTLQQLDTVTVEVPQATATAFAARIRARADVSNVELVPRDAVAYATGRGALVVASAGNAASTTLQYPAAYPQVMAVGATNTATGGRASFSSFGPWVTVAAPGVAITGTTPSQGSSLFAPGYDVANGTSFSSPTSPRRPPSLRPCTRPRLPPTSAGRLSRPLAGTPTSAWAPGRSTSGRRTAPSHRALSRR